MKPAPFTYHRPESVSGALELLVAAPSKVLAGGQSLVQQLNLRQVRTSHLVDINRLPGLNRLVVGDEEIRAGALVRHADLEDSAQLRQAFPLLHRIASRLAYRAVRNRGTVCGGVAYGDPGAEWPVLLLGLGGRVVARSTAGDREIAADDLFVGAFQTALRDDELLVETVLPKPTGWSWGFHKFARKEHVSPTGSMAMVGVKKDPDGWVRQARVAVSGIGDRPVRLSALEDRLREMPAGVLPPRADFERSVVDLQPKPDIHGSSEYKRALAATLARRALEQAVANGSTGGEQ
jgi:carbon-monoxide dehydrogenase medium subunit